MTQHLKIGAFPIHDGTLETYLFFPLSKQDAQVTSKKKSQMKIISFLKTKTWISNILDETKLLRVLLWIVLATLSKEGHFKVNFIVA